MHGVEPHARGFTAGVTQTTYDVADQILTRNGAAYQYDADGNLAQVSGAASWIAGYDLENRLVSVSRSGQPTLASSYDAFGRRAQRIVGSTVEVFRRDTDGRVLSEADGSGGVLAEYVYVDGRLLATVRGGQTLFYLFDYLGSTLAVTDGNGAVTVAYGYDVSGRVLARTGSFPNRFTFVGEHGVEDDGAGLYLMERRHYDAVTGRFVQRDPIGIAGGMNLYQYAQQRPTTLIDGRWAGLLEPAGGRHDLLAAPFSPYHWKRSTGAERRKTDVASVLATLVSARKTTVRFDSDNPSGLAADDPARRVDRRLCQGRGSRGRGVTEGINNAGEGNGPACQRRQGGVVHSYASWLPGILGLFGR